MGAAFSILRRVYHSALDSVSRLEPQDRIGVHGKCSPDSSLAVTASPSTEIFDLALSALGWWLALGSAARAKLFV